MLRTYTIKSKNFPALWVFKYDLNGFLNQFIIDEGEISLKTQEWLFSPNFPYTEDKIKDWHKMKNLEITIGEPDLSFETFYHAYNYRVGKLDAERAWKRLSKQFKIEALQGIKPYNNYCHRKHVEKKYPATYLNKRHWESDFNSIH